MEFFANTLFLFCFHRDIAPHIDQASEKYSDVEFYKLDVDEVGDVAQECGITAMRAYYSSLPLVINYSLSPLLSVLLILTLLARASFPSSPLSTFSLCLKENQADNTI